nr:hypothetical protein [Kibdelosporangium sp. MJ126-NF4]CEL22265.1 hypothetical protein [Kibdelosporangium sp. MJ126-NF4]CTQ93047.1 hypothetical protein [Kibdelosporangium sp. MJ126-NF4]
MTVSFVALFMVASGGVAFAQETVTAMPFNFGGPFGIVVAAVGLSGLLLGCVRFFRKSAKARKTVESPAESVAASAVPQAPVAVTEPDVTPQPAATA